jgi:hypothetical protein
MLGKEYADKIAELESAQITAIIKLASLKLSPSDIVAYAEGIRDGEKPEIDLTQGQVKPLVVQAWSLVNDRKQYAGIYGLTSAEAADLRDTLLADPTPAVETIGRVVAHKLKERGSPRAVRVSLLGMPTGAGAENPFQGDDGGAASLAALIARNSGLYGAYSFNPLPTGRPGPEAYRIDLGGNLAVFGQSKKLATAAARLTRVHGRKFEPIIRFTRMVGNGSPRAPADIKENIWDGILPPGEAPPIDRTGAGTTIA